METIKEFEKVGVLVERLLKEDIRCRNCDKWLTYRVMRHYTQIFIPFEDFNKIPAFETIKRTRAHIQNKEGRYLPTDPKVINKRTQRAKELKFYYSMKKLEE